MTRRDGARKRPCQFLLEGDLASPECCLLGLLPLPKHVCATTAKDHHRRRHTAENGPYAAATVATTACERSQSTPRGINVRHGDIACRRAAVKGTRVHHVVANHVGVLGRGGLTAAGGGDRACGGARGAAKPGSRSDANTTTARAARGAHIVGGAGWSVDAELRTNRDALALATRGGQRAWILVVDVARPVVAAGVGHNHGLAGADVAAPAAQRTRPRPRRGAGWRVGAAPYVRRNPRRVIAAVPRREVRQGAVGFGHRAAIGMSDAVALEKGVHLSASAVRAGWLVRAAAGRGRWRWRWQWRWRWRWRGRGRGG
mmetsp:Transcript_3036/g.6446  ORF Transcript_3036/g.6446 Transcript_3036/m.6446 type:complete len:315 (+) Transcript_3036:691-1635(+)